MSRVVLCASLLLVGLVISQVADGAVVRPMTPRQQAVEADRILIGDVVSVESYWNDDRSLIRSRIEIVPADYLKGAPRRREVLDFVGGSVDDLTLIRTDTPAFEAGQHVLLFLTDDNMLVGAFQGAYHTDGELAVRMGSPLDTVNQASAMPLGLLVAQIAAALGMEESPPVSPYEGDYQIPFGNGRFVTQGWSWAGTCEPMGEDYLINPNSADASAGSDANQIAAIQAGADVWTNENLNFAFSYGGTTTSTSAGGVNGQNIVFFCPSGSCGMSDDTIAVTQLWRTSCGNFIEWDMIFNDAIYTFWDGQTGSCSGMQDIQAVAAHEFGHALGLGHSGTGAATMWASISTCSTSERSLHPDDVAGLAFLYEGQTVVNDICDDAIDITDGEIQYSAACAETDGPTHADCNLFGFAGIDHDIWYRYQATCTGTLTVSTCETTPTPAPAYDTKLGVYDGTDCGNLDASLILCNDDVAGCDCNTSELSVPVVGGQWYLIRVGGWEGQAGAATLNIACDGDPWIPCDGDINGDLNVNLADLLDVLSNWGSPYDLSDLLTVLSNWGNSC